MNGQKKHAQVQGSLFDYDKALERLGGDPVLFGEILILFLEDAPALIDRARQSLADQDFETLERAAHSIKGLSVNFEAQPLAFAAAAIEKHARDRDMQRAQACFPELEEQLQNLRSALAEFRKSHEPQGWQISNSSEAPIDDQQQVTADIDRIHRLCDLKQAGVLSADETEFVTSLEQHRVGSVVGSQIVAAPSLRVPARSDRLKLTSDQRQQADLILHDHGG
jgi:HPt (histidine-containing phosphotransfer) domain-containing protein